MSASVPLTRHGSRRRILMTGAAAVLALTALVVSSPAHRPASGASVQDQRPGSAARVLGIDAWFDDPGMIGAMPQQGIDAWFNDPQVTTKRAPGFDAWFADPASAAPQPGFDAWFNDR